MYVTLLRSYPLFADLGDLLRKCERAQKSSWPFQIDVENQPLVLRIRWARCGTWLQGYLFHRI